MQELYQIWLLTAVFRIMDTLVKLENPNCLEVGVFAGRSMISIMRALQYIQCGQFVGIDSWDSEDAVKGFLISDPNYEWWKGLDYANYNRMPKIF